MRFVVWILVNVLALGAAALLFDGITVTGADRSEQIVTLVIVGAIFGAITSFVKPVIALFSLPVIVLTFGLFLLVINALMLLLTSVIADGLDLGFHVDGFVTAVLGSIVISIVSALVSIVLRRVGDLPCHHHCRRPPARRTGSAWSAWATSAARRWPPRCSTSSSTGPVWRPRSR